MKVPRMTIGNRRLFLQSSIAAGLIAPASSVASSTYAQSPQPASDGTPAGTNNKRKIKFGQIGTQHAHASKLGVYRNSNDYELVGVVEDDPQARRRAQSSAVYANVPWMTKEELLSQKGLEAVLIETHVRDLLSNAQAAVDAGKHVHLDKPAGNDLAAYRKLLDAAASQKLMVQMGYMYRYNPAVMLLRQFLKDGWLGSISEVHAVVGKVLGSDERQPLAEFSGGIMFELGCHAIDLVIAVLGSPSKVTGYRRHSADAADSLADNTLAVLEGASTIGTVRASGVEVDGGNRRHLVVCGSMGTFHIQPLDGVSTATITLDRARGEYRKGTQTKTFSKFVRYVADAETMADVIRGQKPIDFAYEHDWAVQQAVMRASE